MMTQITTIRPGYLVSLKTSLRGNVQYRTETIQGETWIDGASTVAEWQTKKTIRDKDEHNRATVLRSKIRNMITGCCIQSAFGLLCPEANGAQLEATIATARSMADDFNATASITRVTVNVICGRIASDDVQAMKALNSEISELLEDMENGVRMNNAKAIRDAANKARSVGSMLSESARADVQSAIEAARKTARAIVKAGDTAAIEADENALNKIRGARTAFLDMSDDEGIELKVSPVSRVVAFDPVQVVAEVESEVESESPQPEPAPLPEEFAIPRRKGRAVQYVEE